MEHIKEHHDFKLSTCFLTNLANQLPILLTLIVGLIIAIVTWKRHPRTSLLALSAFVILSLTSLLETVTNILLPMLHYDFGYFRMTGFTVTITIVNILWVLLRAGAYALLIAAIFGLRVKKDV